MLRLFIAVNLPDNIKTLLAERLDKIKKNYKRIDIRFTAPEQWHLTLTFLGYQPETALPAVEKSVESNKSYWSNKSNRIEFEKITYGPPGNRGRMIWLTTTQQSSHTLSNLKEAIEKELQQNGVKWQKESRPFHGHITLARFELTPLENLLELNEKFQEDFPLETVDLMKSTLRREGALYEKLFSV